MDLLTACQSLHCSCIFLPEVDGSSFVGRRARGTGWRETEEQGVNILLETQSICTHAWPQNWVVIKAPSAAEHTVV